MGPVQKNGEQPNNKWWNNIMAQTGWHNGKWHGFGTGIGKWLYKNAKANAKRTKSANLKKAVNKGKYTVKPLTKKQSEGFNKALNNWKKKYTKGSYKPVTSSSSSSKKSSAKTGKKGTSYKKQTKKTAKTKSKNAVKKTSKKKQTKDKQKSNKKTTKKTNKKTTKKTNKKTTSPASTTPVYNIVNNYYNTVAPETESPPTILNVNLWDGYKDYIKWTSG